jgi:hypothetical protein
MKSKFVQRKIEPELLSMVEAEFMTGRSRWTWRRDCYAGTVASVKIGRRLFVPLSEVRRVIAESTRPRLDTQGHNPIPHGTKVPPRRKQPKRQRQAGQNARIQTAV